MSTNHETNSDQGEISNQAIMNKLLLLLDRLTATETVPRDQPPRNYPEQIIESLSATIKEFHHDPAASMTFDRCFSKYEDLFNADGRELDDAAKIRLLLRSLSVPVHEKFLNYLLPRHPRDFTFLEVVTKLKSVFGHHKSQFSQRYDCLRTVKNEADDYLTYAGIVNRQCEDFELNKLTIDQFKGLIFVCGLQSSRDADVRTRLLSKLEADTATTVNLESLVTECQRLSNLKHDTALVEKNHLSSSVQAVRNPKQQKHPGSQQSSEKTSPRTPCWQCGAMHFVKDCPFTSHLCKQCNKTGHKEGYCGCFGKQTKPESAPGSTRFNRQKKRKGKYQSQSNYIFSINAVGAPSRKYVTVLINDKPANLQLDCGSDITIVSVQTWKKLGSPSINNTFHRANTASGAALPLKGEFQCSMVINGESKNGTCHVTTVKDLNLLGLDFIEAFNLWNKPLASVCNRVNQSNFNLDCGNRYLRRYPEVFKDTLGHCTKTKIKLFLKTDAKPVFRPKRPVPFHIVQKVDEELNRLQQLDIITPVDFSEWAAPIVVVKKPGGKVRICADYSTGLNAILEPHHYPLPTPDDIFSKLAGSKIFSVINLSDAYLQVEVDDDSKKLLTINTHRGLFQFNRLASGVKSAPGAFQQLMSSVIAGIEGVESFLDDFIIHTVTETDHDRTLNALFSRLQEFGFNLRLETCNFGQSSIKFIGHIVSSNGIQPDPAKISAITQMPRPTDVSQVRSFLGAVSFYGKFVKKMHQLRRPLDNLLKKDYQFVWSQQCQESFVKIKKVLQSDLLLTHYNPALDIIVAGDASKTGIGAVIMHQFPDGQIKAIAHASRTLTASEQNYSQVEKEALALVFAVTKFRRMLLGRHFKLQTDHQPLLKVFGSNKGIPLHTANRLQRWALTLLGFDFDVEYISTDQFGYADVLSRLINKHEKPDEEFVVATIGIEDELDNALCDSFSNLPVTFEMVRSATKKDKLLQTVIQHINTGWPAAKQITDPSLKTFCCRRESLSIVKDCIMFCDRIVVPAVYRGRILKQIHRGHPGMDRMKSVARSIVYWPAIDEDIQNYVRRCSICACAAKSPPQIQPQPWPKAEGPWKRIHLDYAGPIEGMYYLVIVDSFTKWPEIFQISSSTAPLTIGLLRETFARFGKPDALVTDNGRQFCSGIFKQFCEKSGITHIRTAPYHPQSNGQAERFVDTLKRSLRKITDGENIPSSEALQTFLQVYRSTPSNVLEGKSPAEVMFGRPMTTTLDLLRPTGIH
ncbi:uncharacterized protein K02A2.6-like [Wyeomyia smithii]|uniref:uncharacterized protein K02A2.6-like n=1 Tax=Wyeomyia smithii TaxID=174621 RepID=UPI002467D7BA|nr:uncharacterized protein K02A2.6-like [Wyeomyia smithii]